MKGKRRLSGVLLIIAALIIMQLPVSEADAATSASDFKMEGTTLVKYRGTETNVSIPDTVEVIAESAFEENDKVELVVVPNSVKRIEAFAFWGCDNLDKVVLGRGLTEVGDYTFANCKGLEEISIPANVRSIGVQAFADCVNMTDITIPPEVTSIHETAFDGCYKLYIHCEAGSYADRYSEEFYKKQSEMPEYEDVPEYDGSDVTEDTNDDSDNEIDSDDGNDTSSEAVTTTPGTLLGSTQIVGNRAVVFIDNTSPTVLGASRGDATETTDSEPITNIIQETERGNLPKYTIVDGKVVADQAYYKNNTLKQVTLPQGIEEIGQFAFARSSVTEITIPEGVKSIGYGAFYHADSLKEVNLPGTVENVEPKAFTHSLWVDNFLEKGSEDFLISGNVLIAYRGSAEEVVIPEGVKVLAGEAFFNHTEIKKVTLPESLETIGEGAFEGCSGLSEISTGSSLMKIKDRAFAGCSLKEVSLPASVTEVGLKVFDAGVNVNYEGGQTPAATHETSAERLSNEKYRPVTEEDAEPGVTVTGVEPAFASLEGANRSYTLSVEIAENKELLTRAIYRCFGSYGPKIATIYDIQLTDNSGIPLKKLGKQTLTIILPVPEDFANENVVIYTLDRNGQLEQLPCERVLLDGVDAVRFQTNHLSLFGIYGDMTIYEPGEVQEFSTTLESMSAGSMGSESDAAGISLLACIKWTLVVVLLLLGTFRLFRKSKR